ncbi:MAG TPA: helix-turn-helix domain-containing protein [Candidatus Nitrosotalea sp.]|nr:helix-turn-helix domain-containing protein [Candidatus Nitrosotalea sp.]
MRNYEPALDKTAESILDSISNPKSALQLSFELKVSTSTIYRKLKLLGKLHLLKISGSLIGGKRILLYESKLTHVFRNNTRIQTIVKIVENNPGIHYSDLIKITGLTHGVTSHYLFRMERMKIIRIRRDSRRAFIFSNQSPLAFDNILIHLRKETAGMILAFLLEKKSSSFSEIRKMCGKSPSTVSLTLTHLIEQNLVRRIPGISQNYELADCNLTLKALDMINPRKFDSMKDRFADTFSFL